MKSEDILPPVLDLMNEQGVAYMIVGSLAGNFYAGPRSTRDADIVVESRVGDIAQDLSASDPDLKFDPQLAFECVTATTKALLRSESREFEIELFQLSDDEHDRERFARRVRVEFLGREAWIATAEDMIVTKLRWAEHAGREKDIGDLRNIIYIQNDALDWPYIEGWSDRHGTRSLLESIRDEVGAT